MTIRYLKSLLNTYIQLGILTEDSKIVIADFNLDNEITITSHVCAGFKGQDDLENMFLLIPEDSLVKKEIQTVNKNGSFK